MFSTTTLDYHRF